MNSESQNILIYNSSNSFLPICPEVETVVKHRYLSNFSLVSLRDWMINYLLDNDDKL